VEPLEAIPELSLKILLACS